MCPINGYSIREKQLLNGWGELIDTINWTVFCTFTTNYRLTKNSARVKMTNLSEYLSGKHQVSFRIFWVAEPFAGKDNYHIHALIKIDVPDNHHKQSLTEAWHQVSHPAGYKKHNLVAVEKYQPTKGARYYVAKHLQKGNVDYDIY